MTTTTAEPAGNAFEWAAQKALRKKAADDFRAAIEAARLVLGPARVITLADEAGLLPVDDHADCGDPVEREALEQAARMVHEPHDRFRWEHCQTEVCRALAEV